MSPPATRTSPSCLQQRLYLALLAVLQNSLVGGLVYGWASIDRTLLVHDANLTFDQTTAIFSYSTSVGMFSSLLMGPVLDHYGPRKCSVLAHLLVGLGCFIFSLANSFAGFLVATIFITLGGPGIQLSIVHLCSLFPANRYLALATINGSISFSFAVFAVFAAVWQSTEISFRTLFGVHALLIFSSAVFSWFIWPDKPYEVPILDDATADSSTSTPYRDPTLEEQLVEAATAHRHILAEESLDSFLREGDQRALLKHNSFRESKQALDRGMELLVNLKDMPFRMQFTSGTYLRTVATFCTTCFLANFYVASISTELADIQKFNTAEQHELTQTFTLTMSSGIFAALLIGWLMDQVGLEMCTVLTLVLGQIQLVIVLWLADRRALLITSFVCYTLFRSFLFPVYIASLTTNLGYKYFGLLNGIGFACTGLAQAFMSHLVRAIQGDCHLNTHVIDVSLAPLCDHGHWKSLHTVELLALAALLTAPLLGHLEAVWRKRRLREALGSLRSLSIQLSNNSHHSYGSLPVASDYEDGDLSDEDKEAP